MVYAAFTAKARQYTITWKDFDGTTLGTTNAAYGEVPKYSSTVPAVGGFSHSGWDPSPTSCTGNATYYATYSFPQGMSNTLRKSWSDVIANAKAGTTNGYKELDTKVMITTDNKALCFEIAGIKKDSGSTFTWIARTIDGTCQWNTSNSNTDGYPASNYKTYLESISLNHFPANIKNAMKSVSKVCRSYSPNKANMSYTAKIWPPNVHELNCADATSSYYETTGAEYTAYASDAQRIRYNSSGTAVRAWLSSAYYTVGTIARTIGISGNFGHDLCSESFGALPCFCL